jgi:hypothetical protein
LRTAAKGARELVPGARPRLPKSRSSREFRRYSAGSANQPGPLQKAFTDRTLEQNAARASHLDELAGTDGRLDFSKASRDTAASDLYGKAFAEVPEDSRWIKGEITKLTQRPAFVSALKDGQEMAMNLGIKVSPDNPENTTQILHFAKMALDDKIAAAVQGGNKNASRALIDTRDNLVSLMESKGFSPSYREARDTFKQMSGPINEMELAGDLRSKFMPALNDVTGTTPTRVYADSMAGEVRRRGEDLAKMSPEFQGKVSALTSDLQRKASSESLGKATGSPTAQYLTTQNLMRQIMGPARDAAGHGGQGGRFAHGDAGPRERIGLGHQGRGKPRAAGSGESPAQPGAARVRARAHPQAAGAGAEAPAGGLALPTRDSDVGTLWSLRARVARASPCPRAPSAARPGAREGRSGRTGPAPQKGAGAERWRASP